MSEIKNYNVAVTHGNGKAGNIRYYQKGGKTYMRAAHNSVGVFYTKQESQEGAVTAMPVHIASANGFQSIVNTYISASRQLKSNISLLQSIISYTKVRRHHRVFLYSLLH